MKQPPKVHRSRFSGRINYLDEQDRLAILLRMAERGLNKNKLARACDVSSAAMTMLLAKPIRPGNERACRFLDRLHEVLDLGPVQTRGTLLAELVRLRGLLSRDDIATLAEIRAEIREFGMADDESAVDEAPHQTRALALLDRLLEAYRE